METNKSCSTCVNKGSVGCRVMLFTPKELFCWADKETQIKREMDILNYANLLSIKNPKDNLSNVINTAKLHIRKLQNA